MRGNDQETAHLLSYLSPDERVPANDPLRVIRQLTEVALADLSERFELLYARVDRPSVPPETLLRALLLQILYSVRSERLLMEQPHYNLLFRWFVSLGMDDPVWTPTTFTMNGDRLLVGDVAQTCFAAVTAPARDARLLSDEHSTLDGTLLKAAAGVKSIRQ